MKNILIFIDWYEPGYKAGGPIRSMKNLVDHLSSEANFFIVTRNTDYHDPTPYTTVKSDEWCRLEQGVSVYYFSKEKLNIAGLKSILNSKRYDVIYINGIYSWNFSILPLLLLRNTESKVIVAPRGMLAAGALGVKSLKKKIFLRISRFLGVFKNAAFHATNDIEATEIKTHIDTNVEIFVAPNLPSLKRANLWQHRIKERGILRMVSIARISPEKNTLFAIDVLRQISTSSFITLDIYGPVHDESYLKRCHTYIAELPENIKVTIKGSIPNDEVAAVLVQYHLLFLPSRGENFGHVILESLASSTPVLISDKTPWRHLEKNLAGWDVSLDNPAYFAEVINMLSHSSQVEFDRYSQAAYKYALEVITNEKTVNAYRNLFMI